MDVLRFATWHAGALLGAGFVVGMYSVVALYEHHGRKRPGLVVATLVCSIVALIFLGCSVAFIVAYNPVAGGGR